MKVSLKWLKEYVDVHIPVEELAEKLTMAGFEVKETEIIGGSWENVFIGRITAINPHPNADRLLLPTVALGTEQHTVVCGAPNLNIGDKIAFAKAGARLFDADTGKMSTLKPAKIRGVDSSGMVCSERELGISDRHEGILVLPEDAPLGAPLADFLGDTVLNVDITPNRPDCLSVIGIAREVAALTGEKLRMPDISYDEIDPPIDEQLSVEIREPHLCPRYCATLITGVKIGDSPQWMQERLLASGARPINNVVDVTNYVMLEYGQPSHSFDFQEITGGKIIVRKPEEGETIITLDGESRTLSPDMLLVADAERAVALAGIMGGANSEMASDTTSILLEAASWNPANIHYTGRTLNLPSEACMRFERGISRELAIHAIKRATQLIAELGGGKVARGIIDEYPGKPENKPVSVSTEDIKRHLGVDFSLEQMTESLTALGFECKQISPAEIEADIPYWRSDVSLTEDLIEEVARIVGYDRIPTTMLSQPLPRQNPDPVLKLKDEARRSLIGYGFQEIITYSLMSLDKLKSLFPETGAPVPSPLRLYNPMTADLEYLRPTLRANVLSAFSGNRKHEDDAILIFELGKVYLPRDKDLPQEPEMLCGLLSSSRLESSWQSSQEPVDFFKAKGLVEALLGRLNMEAGFEESSDESLHASKQAAIVVNGQRIGVVGELHPMVLDNFDIDETLYLFEVNLPALVPFATERRMFSPVPKFPAIIRDMALVIDAGVKNQQILDIIRSFSLVTDVALFDIYAGEQVAPDKKSLAYRITYQSPSHTLVEDEVNKVQEKILGRLSKELGAVLRS